jgi:hypothetical protein
MSAPSGKSRPYCHIYTEKHWQISYIKDSVRFFKALPIIAPFGSILSFEGHDSAPTFQRFLRAYSVKTRIDAFASHPGWNEQIHFADTFAKDFADFLFNHPKGFYHPGKWKFTHVHGFSASGKMLFWFHDAFTGGFLALNQDMSAARVRRFCSKLGPEYFLSDSTV